MFILRSAIYFVLLFFVFEFVALTGVAWSFYESVTTALQQTSVSSNHRVRDLVLALAKTAEPRMNPAGYTELAKTFQRYVEETKKDSEKFTISEIKLYSTTGILLSSSVEEDLKESPEKRKPDEELIKQTFFKKAIRMRKWEWSSPDSEDSKLGVSLPNLPDFAKNLLKLFPLARANEVRIYAPIYHETKLDVLGAVVLKYQRGNLSHLFEKQFELALWLLINYSVVAFIGSAFLWVIFFLFHYFARKEGEGVSELAPVQGELPSLIEKKTIISSEVVTTQTTAVKPLEEIRETKISKSEPDIIVPETLTQKEPTSLHQSKDVLDAIFLG
ncbi:hypothetical protein LPTSP3_g23400 [Leptospira kobayashii]|uniref:Uncharacterized protein n=1 Tax=Leptospira kobayashii TaxID=1917830 RepID=A0ABN6KKM8_9LEPT|nr:hypothetical protein [Leptospira kobayashii]BDA79410.1 hypothetical protein LPTSP3_g23400 [Leptospira kobayashii]